jgi:hypothetical protein
LPAGPGGGVVVVGVGVGFGVVVVVGVGVGVTGGGVTVPPVHVAPLTVHAVGALWPPVAT